VEATGLPNRRDIPENEQWDGASVFPSLDSWEQALAETQQEAARLSRFQGQVGRDGASVANWLEQSDRIWQMTAKLHVYASLFHHADTTDQEAAAREARARSLYAQVAAATAFGEPEMLALPAGTLIQWAKSEPRLAPYAHYFDELERRRPHIRSSEVEELLGQASGPFMSAAAVHSVLADADLSFAPATGQESGEGAPASEALSQGSIDALLVHPDRRIRQTAWENYADAHLATQNTMASCLATGVQQNVFLARARRYPSSLEAALAENHIPPAVFHNFIDAFRANLPTWHRYWRLRREFLGYDRLHVYDLKAPLSTAPPKVSYDQACRWIIQGMAPLGDEYIAALRQGLNQRWVDARPNRGKRAGAFSTGVQGTHPFILMSYTDDIFSVSTLAHELGHSLHSYFTWQNQPWVYADYSIFVAEVASNFNQAMVRQYLLDSQQDRHFQMALLEEALANFYRYFFIMPTLARFELEIHQRAETGESPTAQELNELMASLFNEGYGEEVERDDQRTGITWAQFPTHLYANFYVYQYGTGISAAHALVRRVQEGGGEAQEAYLDLLRAGSSRYPLDALRQAGVDMTSSQPVEAAFAALAELVDGLEQLLRSR
jgi:oligoendopeptidase F